MSVTIAPATGAALRRVEGRQKLTGTARYAYEHQPEGELAYALMVQSTIARGEVTAVDADPVLAVPGVRAVIWAGNAPRLAEGAEGELAVLQSSRVAYRGQVVAIVIADSLEVAQRAEQRLQVAYTPESHDVTLREDHPGLYKPDKVNPAYPADTERGEFDSAWAEAEVTMDEVYRTPAEHNHPMEPHACVAVWREDGITLYDSNQGSFMAAQTLAKTFGLEPDQVQVIAHHVGGGFGSKGTPRPPQVAAVMASQAVRRPVKLATTRQQMFALTGYRTPTIQHLRLGATADGRLTAVAHDVYEQSSTVQEFAEQTALATRKMYDCANTRTTHRLVRLDVPTPSWMRAPGECPGMFALESAIDELAVALNMDPIALRIANEPERDPESGLEFSSRNLIACLREGAERFGWADRDATPGIRRDGRWLYGSGVAASTYPARRRPSVATARVRADGGFEVAIAAADIGTGARTVLTQIAADALEVSAGRVTLEIGESQYGQAMLAGGSMGTASWGSAVQAACHQLRERIGHGPAEPGAEARYDTADDVEADAKLSRHAFGAQFMEVRVDSDSGEVHVSRALGVFAAGRILNPMTARSQFIGGMTMGIGMALHEESLLDPQFGDYVNHDLAGYHIPSCADIEDIDAIWVDEHDARVNPLGAKGIGEIGIVGTAAAVASAVYHATGVRLRELPIVPPRLIAAWGSVPPLA
jgi:xanthine dehydrogenase YagR molybdenum-binding subunit